MAEIKPRCLAGIAEPYMSAEGYFYPCCWIANEDHLSELKRFLGRKYQQLDLEKHSMDEIEGSSAMMAIQASWVDNSFGPCVQYCSRPLNDSSRNKPDEHFNL
jgi:hypothetical protein